MKMTHRTKIPVRDLTPMFRPTSDKEQNLHHYHHSHRSRRDKNLSNSADLESSQQRSKSASNARSSERIKEMRHFVSLLILQQLTQFLTSSLFPIHVLNFSDQYKRQSDSRACWESHETFR